MKTTLSIIATSLVLVTGQAYAVQDARHPRDPGVNHRQDHQQHRLKQGVKSGELTRAEGRRLHQERKAIRVEERAYKSDGKLTRAERKDLHQDLSALSRDIYRQKHDDQSRP